MTDLRSGGRLETIMAKGEFAVTGELGPPKHTDIEIVKTNIGHLKGAVDAANITDNQTAIVRISSLAASAILMQEGLEPIMQMTVRDRNRIAMQSDVLGAGALGIPNILCLSGDHQSLGSHPESKGVWDLDSMQLIAMVKKMRDDGQFMNGDEIKVPPKVYIGAVWSPFSEPIEVRIPKLLRARISSRPRVFIMSSGLPRRWRVYGKPVCTRRPRSLRGLFLSNPLAQLGTCRKMFPAWMCPKMS